MRKVKTMIVALQKAQAGLLYRIIDGAYHKVDRKWVLTFFGTQDFYYRPGRKA